MIKKQSNQKTITDRLVYVAAIATPIMTLPQVYEVWVKHEKGASLITWSAYTVIASIWLSYAIQRKDIPLLVLEIPAVILYGLISIGLIIYT